LLLSWISLLILFCSRSGLLGKPMPSSFEVGVAVCNNAKTVDSNNLLVSPRRHPAHISFQEAFSPRPHVSKEAAAWYHADNGGALPKYLQSPGPGFPWDRVPYPRSDDPSTTYFSRLGVRPPAQEAYRRKATIPCQWQASPRSTGWAAALLPERPPSMLASLGRKAGAPITDLERNDARYNYRPPEPIRPQWHPPS
jgi:hypothetical protein